MMPELNDHARYRSAQRNVSNEAIAYIIAYGQCFRKAGAQIHYLRSRDIPAWDQCNDRWTRLVGTAVFLSKDGRVILTTWRNRQNGLKRIKQKTPYSRPMNAANEEQDWTEFRSV